MTIKYSGDNITFSDNSIQSTAATGFGFKNRIINGAMMIDQRNAGASIAGNDGAFAVDRWLMYHQSVSGSKGNIQQNQGSVTPPAGYTNYIGFTTTSAYSVAAGDGYGFQQRIEGLNVADLAWGTASAAPVTLSFWVRSSLTGTFGGSLRNSAGNRSYPFGYTISSANTWEQKTVTIAGDTTGTWLTTNGVGIYLTFGLGVGSTYSGTAGAWDSSSKWSVTGATSVVGTNGATFYITGVQLEKGSTATQYDYRPYSTELALCQRYYWKTTNHNLGLSYNASITYTQAISLPVVMRSAPTLDAGASFSVGGGSAGTPALNPSSGGPSVTTVDSAAIYNSAANWTANTYIAFSGGLTSEL